MLYHFVIRGDGDDYFMVDFYGVTKGMYSKYIEVLKSSGYTEDNCISACTSHYRILGNEEICSEYCSSYRHFINSDGYKIKITDQESDSLRVIIDEKYPFDDEKIY